MYLRTLEICALRYKLDSAKCLSAWRLAWQAALKETTVKLDLLTDITLYLSICKN